MRTPENYAALQCPVHGTVVIDRHEYTRQLVLPSVWRCPVLTYDQEQADDVRCDEPCDLEMPTGYDDRVDFFIREQRGS